jgi:hypothetical protein
MAQPKTLGRAITAAVTAVTAGLGACLVLLLVPASTPARAQMDVPDLVCPSSGGRASSRRPASADEEAMPFDLDSLGDFRELPPDVDPAVAAAFRPGVAGVRGPGIRRLAIWGDSHIASGVFGEELQRILAQGGIDSSNSFTSGV